MAQKIQLYTAGGLERREHTAPIEQNLFKALGDWELVDETDTFSIV